MKSSHPSSHPSAHPSHVGMKPGVNVSWTLDTGAAGHGVTITDEIAGHVLVAVQSGGELNHVIWCAAAWLTETPAAPPSTPEDTQP